MGVVIGKSITLKQQRIQRHGTNDHRIIIKIRILCIICCYMFYSLPLSRMVLETPFFGSRLPACKNDDFGNALANSSSEQGPHGQV
eukprot:5100494-Amphidinium_carterae.1